MRILSSTQSHVLSTEGDYKFMDPSCEHTLKASRLQGFSVSAFTGSLHGSDLLLRVLSAGVEGFKNYGMTWISKKQVKRLFYRCLIDLGKAQKKRP